ncbi:hypothetical protein D3C81_1499120 [compost metagenome]
MLEETNTQTSAFRGTFDQTGNVGDHEALEATYADHTEVRHQGGEGIVRHFRLGRGNRTNEGALASIRQAEQTDVCQHLQFQLEIARLARLARRGLPWRAVGTGLEATVAEAVPATLGHHQTLPRLGQVTDDFLGTGINDGRSYRHRQDQVFTLGTGAVLAAAVLPALGIEAPGVAVVHQGIQVLVGLEVYRATVTAITTVGTAFFDELLAAKAHEAIAAVTGFHVNGYFIDEFHGNASRRTAG